MSSAIQIIGRVQYLLMAKVQHYLPQVRTKFFCSKGGAHAEAPLNIVCLDPICRNDPLACSACFTQYHKHRRVVSLEKFIDDYSRNVRQTNAPRSIQKIHKHHRAVKHLITSLREAVNRLFDQFQASIDEYADELVHTTSSRNNLSRQLNIPFEPKQVKEIKNKEELQDFIKFVLNNSLFDSNRNMINVAGILKQDEERVYALLDKMVNMTEQCQEQIKEVMKTLNFSEETVIQEKASFKHRIQSMKVAKDEFDTQQFRQRQLQDQTVQKDCFSFKKPHWRSTLACTGQESTGEFDEPNCKYAFSSKTKHPMIDIKEKGAVGVSNITAIKPQYALLSPPLNPNHAREWTLKINSCRNFASQNTLAVGIGALTQLEGNKYEGRFPKDVLMLTSQGYVIEKGGSRKTEVVFGAGDTLYCRYDPYYQSLEISKDNGRKIALHVDPESIPPSEDIRPCVRLTYASDQVQIL